MAYLENFTVSAEVQPGVALADLVGRSSSDPELSSSYKRELTDSLHAKT